MYKVTVFSSEGARVLAGPVAKIKGQPELRRIGNELIPVANIGYVDSANSVIVTGGFAFEMTASDVLNEDGGALIPAFRDWLDAHNDKVGGHTPHGGFDMDNGMILDKAWLKS